MFDDFTVDIESNKNLSPIVNEWFLIGKNSIFHLFLSHNLISKCPKL